MVFRLGWGLWDGLYARFTHYWTTPRAFVNHFLRRGEPKAHTSPGVALAVVLLLAVAVQVGTGLFATDDIFNEGPLNRYRLTSLLNPKMARKDDHRLARDANVFTPNLNFHEARAARTLERPHLPFAKLLRPVGREESVSAAGHGVFVGACPRPEVAGVEIVVTHTGSGDQHAVNRIMRLVQRPEIRCQVDQHRGIGNLQHQYVRFLVVCGVLNHLDAKRGQQHWGASAGTVS